MNYKSSCAICGSKDWRELGKRQHKITDIRWQAGYPKIQKFVFFNIWHPQKKKIKKIRCICQKCGFVNDFPRPDKKDISQKYEYLARVEKYLGTSKNDSKKAMKKEFKQAESILKLAIRYLNKKPNNLEILDYGGGDGHFLLPMEKRGSNVYLVDYNRYPVKKVIHLGTKLKDISPHKYKFDLIICRHVLEHLASPKETLVKFKDYLKKDGLVYAEVPIQLFRALKPNTDPVTHINYFQSRSLEILFKLAGFKTLFLKKGFISYHGHKKLTARILTILRNQGQYKNINIKYKKSYKETIYYIKPPLLSIIYMKKIGLFIRSPRRAFKALKSKLQKI